MRPFPAAANLLIETPSEGRTAATAVLQAMMFRFLTSLPPGKVRFTIVDPVGLGETSPPSCTWPTTTSRWSPTGSGPSRSTSSSGWPT